MKAETSALSFVLVLFVLMVAIFIMLQIAAIYCFNKWTKQRHAKVKDATMVTKRSQCYGTDEIRYYATFEMKDKSRQELQVPEKEYGLLAVGDKGKLSSRKKGKTKEYVSFKR